MFIDKSSTVNNWAASLTSNNSTLSFELDGILLINEVESISDEDNEFIMDNHVQGQPTEDNANEEIEPPANVENKPPTKKCRRTHQQRSKESR
ncbi:unnamed protein product [Rotaria sordida]|uniref:Uncharacterized protein n=1 Tax=Rotaria sordida TaxID=392033 RepID=A0A814XNP5_9BILA|nr:unnamed protein product [Rotaria sordida]CAF4085577.1 unnamed protein product [Rotaria sordida]